MAFQNASSKRSGTSFVTGSVYTPLEIWIATTRTSQPLPGTTFLTWATATCGPSGGNVCSPLTQTMSPTFKFGEVQHHLLQFCSWPRYSADQCFHILAVKAWHRCHHLSNGTERKEASGSWQASSGPPTRKCPGVNTSISLSESGRAVSGLEFKHASIWASVMVSSSNVRPQTTHPKWCLKVLTAASNSPSKCGACSGVKFHLMPCSAQK